MKLTLHYKNEAHKKDFITTETFHGDRKRLKDFVVNRENIIKAYLNGKVINVSEFIMEDSK
jgi:hypothetical protein